MVNRDEADDDKDLLSDKVETQLNKSLPPGAAIKRDTCRADTDDDGVEDGYEYRSAHDLNDDENQQPNKYLAYPGKRPYPNPVFKSDAEPTMTATR